MFSIRPFLLIALSKLAALVDLAGFLNLSVAEPVDYQRNQWQNICLVIGEVFI